MIEPVRKCNKCAVVIPEGRAFTRAAIELIAVGTGNRAERFDGDLCSQGCLLAVFKAMLSQESALGPDNGRPVYQPPPSPEPDAIGAAAIRP